MTNADERAQLLEIAKLAGWRIERLPAGGYRLIGPQDETYGIPEKYASDDDEAWHIASLNVPNYIEDANAALALLAQMPDGAVFVDGEKWGCTAYIDGAGIVADATADIPALAICKAWLAWKAAGDGDER